MIVLQKVVLFMTTQIKKTRLAGPTLAEAKSEARGRSQAQEQMAIIGQNSHVSQRPGPQSSPHSSPAYCRRSGYSLGEFIPASMSHQVQQPQGLGEVNAPTEARSPPPKVGEPELPEEASLPTAPPAGKGSGAGGGAAGSRRTPSAVRCLSG